MSSSNVNGGPHSAAIHHLRQLADASEEPSNRELLKALTWTTEEHEARDRAIEGKVDAARLDQAATHGVALRNLALAERTAIKVGWLVEDREVTVDQLRTLRAEVDAWMKDKQAEGTIAATKRESVRPAMKAAMVDACESTGVREVIKGPAGDKLVEAAIRIVEAEGTAARAVLVSHSTEIVEAKKTAREVRKELVIRIAGVVLAVLLAAGMALAGRLTAPGAAPPVPAARP